MGARPSALAHREATGLGGALVWCALTGALARGMRPLRGWRPCLSNGASGRTCAAPAQPDRWGSCSGGSTPLLTAWLSLPLHRARGRGYGAWAGSGAKELVASGRQGNVAAAGNSRGSRVARPGRCLHGTGCVGADGPPVAWRGGYLRRTQGCATPTAPTPQEAPIMGLTALAPPWAISSSSSTRVRRPGGGGSSVGRVPLHGAGCAATGCWRLVLLKAHSPRRRAVYASDQRGPDGGWTCVGPLYEDKPSLGGATGGNVGRSICQVRGSSETPRWGQAC